MPPRFTPVQPQQPPALTGRFTPATSSSRFTQTGGTTGPTPNPLQAGLGIAGGANKLLGLGARFTDSPNLGMASRGLSGVLGLGTGAMQLGQGRTIPGSLAIAGGAGNIASAAGQFTQTPALQVGGSALGAAAGLGGIGYGLAQGNQAGDRMAVESMMGLIGSLVPPLGAAYLGGKVLETALLAGLGEGMFGQTKLPFGRGNQFSSADNLASQTSKFRSLTGSNLLQANIQKAQSPVSLLQMAGAGAQLAPYGELQFSHPSLGFGGDWDDPQSPQFTQALQAISQTGDPNLLRQFISGIRVHSGESGATTPNYALTDWYRRSLASKVPGLDTTGLFEPMPTNFVPNKLEEYFRVVGQKNEPFAAPENLWQHATGLSPLFRSSEEMALPPEALARAGTDPNAGKIYSGLFGWQTPQEAYDMSQMGG